MLRWIYVLLINLWVNLCGKMCFSSIIMLTWITACRWCDVFWAVAAAFQLVWNAFKHCPVFQDMSRCWHMKCYHKQQLCHKLDSCPEPEDCAVPPLPVIRQVGAQESSFLFCQAVHSPRADSLWPFFWQGKQRHSADCTEIEYATKWYLESLQNKSELPGLRKSLHDTLIAELAKTWMSSMSKSEFFNH